MLCIVLAYLRIGFLHILQIFSCGLPFQTRQQMKELQEQLYLFTDGGITGKKMSSECCGWLQTGSSETEHLG